MIEKLKAIEEKVYQLKLAYDYAKLLWYANFSNNWLQKEVAKWAITHWDEIPDR